MNENLDDRIRKIEFEYRGYKHTFQRDVISLSEKGLPSVVVETPLSITKYIKSDEDVINICKLILDAYYRGVDSGKRLKQQEICSVLGL